MWWVGSAAWILDESELAIRLLRDAMERLRAPGLRGTSCGSLTVLGWAYIDTGRWDEALDVAGDAAEPGRGEPAGTRYLRPLTRSQPPSSP